MHCFPVALSCFLDILYVLPLSHRMFWHTRGDKDLEVQVFTICRDKISCFVIVKAGNASLPDL